MCAFVTFVPTLVTTIIAPITARLVVLLGLSLSLAIPASATALTLVQAQHKAQSDSPRLAEIIARYDAALEVPEQAGALPDPTLTIGLLNVPTDGFALDQEAMTQFKVGFLQPIPWLSERELSRSSAQHMADATEEELKEARNQLRRDVTRSWWSLYFIDHSLAVVTNNLQRLREFNRIAQSRYRVGKGLQQDALLAQLQLSAQLEQQLDLQGQRRNRVAQLNALLAQPSEQIIDIDLTESPLSVALPSMDRLIDSALKQRPLIRRQQRLVDAAKDRQELAREDLSPDLVFGASYGFRQDTPSGASRADLASITLGIKLPLYSGSKQHKAIKQRGAELSSRKLSLYDTQLRVRSEVVQALSDYQRADEKSGLLQQGMIPQSKQTVASMLSGYQVGKVDFSALVQSQLMVNRLQLQYWKAVSDGQQALASLDAAVGGDLLDQVSVISASKKSANHAINGSNTHE